MPNHAKPLLLRILRRAVELEAEEVRIVTGQQPALKLRTKVISAFDAPTRGELVQALHEAGLQEAQREDLRNCPQATYTVALPELGVFRCEFKVIGQARTLKLSPEHAGGLQALALPRPEPNTGSSGVEPGESN